MHPTQRKLYLHLTTSPPHHPTQRNPPNAPRQEQVLLPGACGGGRGTRLVQLLRVQRGGGRVLQV